MKKLMLIDGMAMVYRAYYALNRAPRLNSKGMNTSATLGFTTSLYELLRSQQPTHVAVAFDLQKPTFRHLEYPPYKANRDAMPEDIQRALPYIHSIIEAFRIPELTCEGYEADDVVGTASAMAEQMGFDEVLMVTPDKDFAQLVTEHVHLYRFGRGGKPDSVYGVKEVCEAFCVQRPSQVADVLGLWGDSIDNIPGIPGVGEKKAKQLVEQFGSVEALVRRSDEIANQKLRDAVKQYSEQALMCKRLATIVMDAPIRFSEELVERKEPDYVGLRDLFKELEFRTFAKKVFTDLSVTNPSLAMQVTIAPSATGTPGHFPTEKKIPAKKPNDKSSTQQALLQFEDEGDQLSLFSQPERIRPSELEVGDLALEQRQLAGKELAIVFDNVNVAVATSADTAFVTTVDQLEAPALKAMLESGCLVICYDLKNLKYILREWGVILGNHIFDVQLAHYLVDTEARHSFDFICNQLLGTEAADVASSAAALWQIYPLLVSKLREGQMEKLYSDVELPLVDVLMSMEQEGVRIDVEALRQYSTRLSQQRDTLEQEIYGLAGGSKFNINSSKQLGEVLYEKMKIVASPPRTSRKQYSTAEDVLKKLRDNHPIVDKVLEYRSLNKLIGTYLDSFPNLINPETGRLHTIYNQTVTTTGRLSSSNPNLQNIPIRSEQGKEIRKAFVARNHDYVILAADYSQIELRIFASLAKDDHMIESFARHYDIHAATAAKIFHLPMEQVGKDLRRKAKSVSFGILYGISAFGLSEQLDIPRKDAAQLIDDFFREFPKCKDYIERCKAFAHEHGYAQTLLGRRRYLYDINSRNAAARSFAERNAVNMPIQGTSADMIKIAMIRIFDKFREQQLKSRMILQVHDELVFDVYKPEEWQVRQIVEHEMVTALPLSIPIEVGIEVGDNWLEAH